MEETQKIVQNEFESSLGNNRLSTVLTTGRLPGKKTKINFSVFDPLILPTLLGPFHLSSLLKRIQKTWESF